MVKESQGAFPELAPRPRTTSLLPEASRLALCPPHPAPQAGALGPFQGLGALRCGALLRPAHGHPPWCGHSPVQRGVATGAGCLDPPASGWLSPGRRGCAGGVHRWVGWSERAAVVMSLLSPNILKLASFFVLCCCLLILTKDISSIDFLESRPWEVTGGVKREREREKLV